MKKDKLKDGKNDSWNLSVIIPICTLTLILGLVIGWSIGYMIF